MEKVLNVAQYLFDAYKKMAGETIDQMKLHKLLYFAQRESLALTGKPLFDSALQGWKYGPVSTEVRTYFTEYGIQTETEEVSIETAYLLNNILMEYEPVASWKLSKMSPIRLRRRAALSQKKILTGIILVSIAENN